MFSYCCLLLLSHDSAVSLAVQCFCDIGHPEISQSDNFGRLMEMGVVLTHALTLSPISGSRW